MTFFNRATLVGMLILSGIGLARGQSPPGTAKPSDILQSRWSLGVSAGGNFNYFTDEQPHRAVSPGFNGQVRVDYNLNKKLKNFSIIGSLGYAGTGGNLVSFYDQTFFGFDPTLSFKNVKQSTWVLHTLESSLGLSYKVPLKTAWKLQVYAAPVLSINMGEWERYQKTGNLLVVDGFPNGGIIGTVTNRQFTDKFEPYWWSVKAGAVLSLPLKKNMVTVDLGFVNGTSPANFGYSYINTPGIQGNIRTNSVRLAFGYHFNKLSFKKGGKK